ncbi:MAG: ATP-binding protein, partial [Methanocorpusculum sp.]|nr:ATP-binding protein [Methanocorpusculum sp.]
MAERETEGTFYDFKVDYAEPEKIGTYISALSNAALLAHQPYGYLIYGIDDKTHQAVGTKFKPASAKGKGNEDLGLWLIRLLTPHLPFEIHELSITDKRVVLFLIPAAKSQPTSFMKTKYIRIDSHVQRLDDYPLIEQNPYDGFQKKIVPRLYTLIPCFAISSA